MARFKLIDGNMPKSLWHLAVQEAAYTRNRCFNKHTGTTPYTAMTGEKCDLSKVHKFGSECYAYQQDRGKLDSRCEKGFFVGHDKYSPAFLVYYPNKGKVQKHRLVKFVTQTTSETETQTQEQGLDSNVGCEEKATLQNCAPSTVLQTDCHQQPVDDGEKHPMVTSQATSSGRYPTRERKPPEYLKDYTQDDSAEDDSTLISMDYCYRAVSGMPLAFKEAIASTDSERW